MERSSYLPSFFRHHSAHCVPNIRSYSTSSAIKNFQIPLIEPEDAATDTKNCTQDPEKSGSRCRTHARRTRLTLACAGSCAAVTGDPVREIDIACYWKTAETKTGKCGELHKNVTTRSRLFGPVDSRILTLYSLKGLDPLPFSSWGGGLWKSPKEWLSKRSRVQKDRDESQTRNRSSRCKDDVILGP
jgi:hypothetical protein